jgi:hypothetical protein
MEPGQLIGLVAVAGGLLVALSSVLMRGWVKMRFLTSENLLKQDMLERGMSAEEIRTVLDAGMRRHHNNRSC